MWEKADPRAAVAYGWQLKNLVAIVPLVLVLVVRMVRTEPYNASVPFWDLAAHPRGMHPFNPVKLGIGRDPTASSILTPHNSCDLTPPMRGTQQNWSLV